MLWGEGDLVDPLHSDPRPGCVLSYFLGDYLHESAKGMSVGVAVGHHAIVEFWVPLRSTERHSTETRAVTPARTVPVEINRRKNTSEPSFTKMR